MALRRPVACGQLTATSASLALLLAASAAVATGPEGTSVPKPHEYDCGDNWLEAFTAFLGGGWPEDKKEWCCKHRKVGCKTEAAANKIQYDCHKSYDERDKAWSDDKRTWCCDHEQLGCKTSAWNQEPYDCRLSSHWREEWSRQKKAWCCTYEGHGCITTTSTELLYDCIEGLLMWQHRWSPERQAWCCRHHDRGCWPTTTKTEELPSLLTDATDDRATTATGQPMRTPEDGAYNCSGDSAKWQTWPMGKQAKCCDSMRCPVGQRQRSPLVPLPQETVAPKTTTTTAATATTTVAAVTTVATTTVAPVTTVVTTATATATTGEPFDCEPGEANAPQGWTGWKKEWCCYHHRVGCLTSTTRTTSTLTLTTSSSKPYDCREHHSDPQTWSLEKKKWCCTAELRGCTYCDSVCLIKGVVASCRNRIDWLKRRGQECPRARHIVLEECSRCERCEVEDACPATADIEKKFDCKAGFANWEAGWSRAKKDWCCRTFDIGCPPPTTVTSTTVTEPFDCNAGLADWQSSWHTEKKAWCCRFKRIGCTGCDVMCLVEDVSASCRDRVGWLVKNNFHDKEDACTKGYETVLEQCRSCSECNVTDACPAIGASTSVPYDCKVGRAHWRHWSEGKRSWCCRHADVGCSDAEEQAASLGSFGSTRVRTAVATTTATTTFTSTTEESFDCKSGVLHWKEAWPERKKEWCCSHYKLGCTYAQSHSPQAAPSHKEVVLPLQWVARDALPEQQGETLQGYSVTARSTEQMKRWCEDRSDCVGFAAQLQSLRWAPKKVGTGFNARTADWTTDQPEGQVWRWYYIKERAEAAEASELAEKFEQSQRVSVSSRAWTLLGAKEVPFFVLGVMCLLLAALFAVRSAGIGFMGREDRFPVYVALQPAQGGAMRDLGQELSSSASFSSHVNFFE